MSCRYFLKRKCLTIENTCFINFAKYAFEVSRELLIFLVFVFVAGTLTKIEKITFIPSTIVSKKRIQAGSIYQVKQNKRKKKSISRYFKNVRRK